VMDILVDWGGMRFMAYIQLLYEMKENIYYERDSF